MIMEKEVKLNESKEFTISIPISNAEKVRPERLKWLQYLHQYQDQYQFGNNGKDSENSESEKSLILDERIIKNLNHHWCMYPKNSIESYWFNFNIDDEDDKNKDNCVMTAYILRNVVANKIENWIIIENPTDFQTILKLNEKSLFQISFGFESDLHFHILTVWNGYVIQSYFKTYSTKCYPITQDFINHVQEFMNNSFDIDIDIERKYEIYCFIANIPNKYQLDKLILEDDIKPLKIFFHIPPIN